MVASSISSSSFKRFKNLSVKVDFYNYWIRDAVNQNDAHKALFLFRDMKQNALQPNNWTFPFLSKACAFLSNLHLSQIIHAHIIKSPFCSNLFVQTAMVNTYLKCHQLDMAYNLFVEMPNRDVASWNVMLLGFVQLGFSDRAFDIFQEMRSAGIMPDSVTIMGICEGISSMENLRLAKVIHSFGIQVGLDTDVSVANTWISLYTKCGDLHMAVSVFDGIEVGLRSTVSWNSMIAGYAYAEKLIDALNCYKLMLLDGFWPDISTIVSLLSSCLQPVAAFQGMQIHSHGIRFGCDSDIHVVNTLISMYSRCGDLHSARCLFDSLQNRSCVTWTAMISGYAKKGNMDEALKLFNAMQAAGDKPDLVTVLALISGCGQIGVLDVGKSIDAYASSNCLKHNVVVCNALIDMYAKCGSICDAREVFDAMADRTIVSWTTMIAGFALNGLFGEAFDLFYRMIDLGLKPNDITFLAILQACTHGGLLEKGWEFFNMMTRNYKINLGLDHYSCMADLLGRKGMVKEALEFIQGMPLKPDAAIWKALLSASKIHGNTEIGEYAAHKLFEMDPLVSFLYVEMANIYASEGRWSGVEKMRRMMRSSRVRKCPGQSLVEVNGTTYAFTVEERGHSHSEMELVYGVLEGLASQSKEEDSSLSTHSNNNLDFEFLDV
ncbi:pentatricopeptide repeat-containing protein At4g19191, mitochondrial isoform X1 [Euphorbia lathyris]|uniref:pentatricopeptide repeat-containing protein At4g19191, mitochondrial isoform X1 n=1 Tax=Euphorbia lathyris TaxID=212925 RepID=UPI0033130E15